MNDIEEFVNQIKQPTPPNPDDAIVGGLIDSYVAGYSQSYLKKTEVFVSKVFDYQYAYGFVITNRLNGAPMEKCLRKALSMLESRITKTIQEKMIAFPVRLNKLDINMWFLTFYFELLS